jgi:hypothetical protein
MTETHPTALRADLDILEDIEHLIAQYPPSRKDQHSIHVQVKDGHVTLTGHVQTPNTRRYLLDLLPGVSGVQSFDAEQFFDDESIRLDVGKVLPMGAQLARIQYGTVILSGKLADGQNAEGVVARVGAVPGVTRVITDFRS